MKNLFLILIATFFFGACSNDDNPISIEVTAENFETNINENPLPMQEIGYIIGNTNHGSVHYEVEFQNPPGAFSVDSDTGLLRVADPTQFRYDIDSLIVGSVRVSNGDIFTSATVKIGIIQEVVVNTSDFEISIEEMPEHNQLLGTIEGTTNQGEVEFNLISQNSEGAFTVDSETGELRVGDASLFVYQENPTLTGVVRVSNGEIYQDSNIYVSLIEIDFCTESNELFQQELLDWGENESDVYLTYTMDARTHEYTFTPNFDTSLCSIGYQSYSEEIPYLMELVDGNGTVIFSEMIAFSSTEQSVHVLSSSIDLDSNETYTIRRTQNDYTMGNEILGYTFLSRSWNELNFPFVFNDITVTGSNFYGGGGPILDMGIPFISLGFE